MADFPIQGGDKDNWGTKLRTFFGRYFNLATGDMNDSSVPGNVITDNTLTNSKLLDGTITASKIESAYKDGTSGTTSLRTLGTGANQACAGNDSRLSQGAAGVATVRALGTGATDACAGNDSRLIQGIITIPSIDLQCVGPQTIVASLSGAAPEGRLVALAPNGIFTFVGYIGGLPDFSSSMLGIAVDIPTKLIALPGSFFKYHGYSFTVGAELYYDSSGTITQTQPSATNSIIRKIGYAVDVDTIYFNPSPDWIQHV